MTNPHLALEGVSLVLPDGRPLFSALDAVFEPCRIGLVGRNGVGKTLLLRILAGELAPTTGRCLRHGRVHRLAQQVAAPEDASVASLAGVSGVLAALARIEAGGVDAADFDALGERWDIRQRLQRALCRQGLDHLEPGTLACRLSGGERMRVALAGAELAEADFLLLDEPSNHLDRSARRDLLARLEQWPGGLLVASHDRALLDTMQRIAELSPGGLRWYGGGHGFYAAQKAQEQNAARRELEHCRIERRRETRALHEQHERSQRQRARGEREGRDANQAPILLGRRRDRSEDTAGRLQKKQAQAREALDVRVREAATRVAEDAAISLHALAAPAVVRNRVALLHEVELPHVRPQALCRIDLVLRGGQRVGVVGDNGCGKSTLLSVLAGRLPPLSGMREVVHDCVLLDQSLDVLPGRVSAFDALVAAAPSARPDELRTRLAHLGLDAGRIHLPSEVLSGGERLKAALACVLYAERRVELLLLDEPGNHLDLPSLQALEAMLRDYRGALVVVSHDDALLDALELDHRLSATDEGWQMRHCPSR